VCTVEKQYKRFFVYVPRQPIIVKAIVISSRDDERRTSHEPCNRLPRGIGSIVLPDKSDFRDRAITFLKE